MKEICTAIICLFCPVSFLFSQRSSFQEKAWVLKRMIELKHYFPKPVDDSFSIAVFNSVINTADPRGLYFTAPEYKQLSARRYSLDDEINGGNSGFFELFKSLYKRSLTRADSIIMQIQKPFDFAGKEFISYRQAAGEPDFAIDAKAQSTRWQKYLKYKVLTRAYEYVEDSTELVLKPVLTRQESSIREKIKKAQLKRIRKYLENPVVFDAFITNLYLNSIASTFDPHTNYFSPEQKEEFRISVSSEDYFFGIEFNENEKGEIVVENISPGGPAWKSGEINKGDQLISLLWEGQEVQDVETADIEEVFAILDQSNQNPLLFRFRKPDGTMSNVMLKKEKLENEENIVKSYLLKGEKKVGYILLPGFYTEWETESGSSCANDVAKEILKLKKENIEGLILDVRYNGGGSLGETLEMAGIFIDEGPFIAEKTKEQKIITLKDPNRGTIYDGPLVLMVNGQSASASEILAAILQDYNRAVIVGSPTFGKATMQQVFPMDTISARLASMESNKDAVKITVAKLFRMDGKTVQLRGVTPDILLPDAFDGLEIGERFEKFALTADTVRKNNYYKLAPKLPVAVLSSRSATRIASHADFIHASKLMSKQRSSLASGTLTIPLDVSGFESWAKIFHEGPARTEDKTAAYVVENHELDKKFIQNNIHAKTINESWLRNLGEDFYLEEAFLVLSDLINLQKSPTKN